MARQSFDVDAVAKHDHEMTLVYLRDAWRRCPHCNATPGYHYIHRYMDMHKDGQLWCDFCNTYLGMWEPHTFELKEENIYASS